MRAAPSCHMAPRRCCLLATVSDSRAKVPMASTDWASIKLSAAACFAARSNSPPTLAKLSGAASAEKAAAVRLAPYRSIGLVSPRRAEESASTASLVAPPNWVARSAPSTMTESVGGASSSIGTPAFLNRAPMSVPSSAYSPWARPTRETLSSAQARSSLA